MNAKLFAAAAVAALSLAAPASALTFRFEFDNVVGTVAGTLKGEIHGLDNNASGQASKVVITSLPAAFTGVMPTPFTIQEFTDTYFDGVIYRNWFTVTNNQITYAEYQTEGGYFDINIYGWANGLTSKDGSSSIFNEGGFSAIRFSGPVPEPATWALMIAGFGLTGATLRRRQAVSVA